MIQELKIKNFKSFRDEAELSFEPSGEDRYNSVVTMPDGVQLLRFAVVLGANASGKSNLLDAIEFLRTFWNNIPATNNDGTDVQPFLMREDALSFDTEFEVKFYVDSIRYWYQLTVNPEKVCREVLFVYLSNRPTKVFCREDVDGVSKLNFNPAVAKLSQAEIEVMSMNCLRNMSVLAVLKKVNIAVPYLDNMRRWIDTRMLPLQSGTLSSLSSEAKKHIADSEDFRDYLMQFAKEADYSDIPYRMKPERKTMLCRKPARVPAQNVWLNWNRSYIPNSNVRLFYVSMRLRLLCTLISWSIYSPNS